MDKKTYTYDKIIGKVESAREVKRGEKDGRQWVMYEVFINNQKFSAFDPEYQAMIGVEGTYDFRVDDQGRKTLAPLKKAKPESSDYRIMDALKRIEQKIDRLGETLAPEPTPADMEEPKYPECITEEDLPF